MEEPQVYVGMILNNIRTKTFWRLLYIDSRISVVIQIYIDKRVMHQYATGTFIEAVHTNKYVPVSDDDQPIVDLARVSDTELEKFKIKLAFIREVRDIYGPTYMKLSGSADRPEFVALYNKYNYERHRAYRYVLAWLQSGLNDYSLLHKKIISGSKYERQYVSKPGPRSSSVGIVVDDTVKAHFDYGIQAYRKNRVMKIRDAFDLVISTFYSTIEDNRIRPYPPELRPTERQFTYYLHRKLSTEDIEKKQTSVREFENDRRLFLQSPSVHDMGPGAILEADAMEMDFNIVSVFNKQKNIGRPILYMLTDRYSHCIVGFHVGFDNNSLLGLTNAILNLFDDRSFVLRSHGIKNFDLNCWPQPFIPNEFWCDRGSDFASDQFARICGDLGIVRTLEEAAKGSMKGLIERSFGLFNTLVLPLLVGKGIIEKRYDSTHKRDACLTIEEAYQVAAAFVAYRNSTPMKNYRPSRDMMKAGIDLSPISIWNYGCKLIGPPRPVTPANQLVNMYRLLIPATGSITREGISFKGLIYCNGADDNLLKLMYSAKANSNKRDLNGRRLNSFDFRIDPRSINEIFYECDGYVKVVQLADGRNGDYKNMTWDEYDDALKNLKDIRKSAAEKILKNKIEARSALENIISGSITGIRADSRDILSNRKLDQNESNFNNRVVKRIPQASEQLESALPDIEIEATNSCKSKELATKDKAASSLFDEECPAELLELMK